MKPYYDECGIQIYHGDNCNVLAAQQPASVNLVVTSPPYDNLRTYGNSPGLTANEYEKQHGFENGQLRKRLNDLWRAGMIQKGQDRLCSVSKRRAQTWLV